MSREIRHSTECSKRAAQSEQVFRNSGLTTSIGNLKLWKRKIDAPPLACSSLGPLTPGLLGILCFWAADASDCPAVASEIS